MLCMVIVWHPDPKHFLFILITSLMTATYLWLDSTKNYATFLVGAFRKVYLPAKTIEALNENELNEYLTDACMWFISSPIKLC